MVLKIEFKSKIYLSFNTLFFLSFFLTSFAYALFVHDTPAELLNVVGQHINFGYLSKCSALCLIASSVYTYGYLSALQVRKCSSYANRIVYTKESLPGLHLLKIVYVTIFLLLFALAFSAVLAGSTVFLEGGDLLSSLFETIFPVVLLCNSFKEKPGNIRSFAKVNAMELTLGAIMMLLFVKIGDRGLIITCGVQIIIIFILCISRLKLWAIGLLMVLGAAFMFVIRQTRMSDDFTSTTSSMTSFVTAAVDVINSGGAEYGFWFYLSDLTNISWELCLGYEYSLTHDLFYPIEEIILNLASPIPLLPSLISTFVFGKTTADFTTGMALNHYMASVGDGNFGNHCVIDVYMMWGIIGVLFVFYFFGFFVAKCYNKTFDKLLFVALYVLLVSNAVYIPRNMVLSLIRPAVYVWFFVWVAHHNTQKRKNSTQVLMPGAYNDVNR